MKSFLRAMPGSVAIAIANCQFQNSWLPMINPMPKASDLAKEDWRRNIELRAKS